MKFVSDLVGFPKNVEVCVLIFIALVCAISDKSIVEVRSNLQEVWALSLDPYRFPPLRQIFLKYIISAVLLIRTFTLHPHLACLVIMVYPAVLEDKPSLLLPWLGVAVVRYFIADTIAIGTGLYIYFNYGIFNMRNVEYLVVQIIEHGPAFYMWFCVYSFYIELLDTDTDLLKLGSLDTAERRRRARSLMSSVNMRTLTPDDDRYYMSSTVLLGVIHPFQRQFSLSSSRSIDTLMSLKAAQEQQEEIMSIVFESTPSGTEKPEAILVMKALGISEEDIIRAKRDGQSRIMSHFSKDDITLDANDKKLFVSRSDGHLIKSKMTLNNLLLNYENSSFTSSRVVRKTPESVDMIKEKGSRNIEEVDGRTVEEMEQLLSDDMLSEDNYISVKKPVTIKASRTFSFITNTSKSTSSKSPNISTSRSLTSMNKLTKNSTEKSYNRPPPGTEPEKSSNDTSKPVMKNISSHNKKHKVSIQLPKSSNVSPQSEFLKNDHVAKTKTTEINRMIRIDRKRASYDKIKQKAEAINYINSVSSGATSKYKAKYSYLGKKDTRTPQDHSDKNRKIPEKKESSCQVSTLSRKVLNSPKGILIKK